MWLGITPGSSKSKAWYDWWLEYRYGWTPLIHDIIDLVKWFEDNDLHRPEPYKAYVKRNLTANKEEVDTSNYVTFGSMRSDIQLTWKCKYRAFVRLDYQLANGLEATASQFGLLNLPSLAWELTTLSWMADWFTGLGTYFSSLDADRGWTFIGGSLTKVSDARVEIRALPPYSPYSWVTGSGDVSVVLPKRRHFEMDRTVYTSSPDSILPYLRPDWFKTKRLVDTLAVLSQWFSVGGTAKRRSYRH
jgi:hypothetical protein